MTARVAIAGEDIIVTPAAAKVLAQLLDGEHVGRFDAHPATLQRMKSTGLVFVDGVARGVWDSDLPGVIVVGLTRLGRRVAWELAATR